MAGVPGPASGPVGNCRDAGQLHSGLAEQQGQSAGVVSVTAKINVEMDKHYPSMPAAIPIRQPGTAPA